MDTRFPQLRRISNPSLQPTSNGVPPSPAAELKRYRAEECRVTNEGEVYFVLYGDEFNPDEVTRLAGLAPTCTKRRGMPAPKRSTWTYSAGNGEEIEPYYALPGGLKPGPEGVGGS